MTATKSKILLCEEENIFYIELARAIVEWANVEHCLSLLVHICVENNERETLDNGFYSIENFRSKLQFVSTLIKTKFKEHECLENWKNIEERVITLSAKRNKLVHFRFTVFQQNKEGKRYALIPFLMEIDINKPPPQKNVLFLPDIIQIRYDFFQIWKDLIYYRDALLRIQVLLPESSLQSKKIPPSIHTLRDQIRKELLPQH